MKKQIVFVVMVIVTLAACNNGGDGTNFTVSGKIENAKAKIFFRAGSV